VIFKRKKRRRFLYLIIFSVLLFFVNYFFISFSDIAKYSYSCLLYPVLLSQEYIAVPIKKFFQERQDKQELREVIFKLHKKNKKLLSENMQLRSTQSFYEQIKEIVDFKERYKDDNLQFCQIIFKHTNDNSHFIFIDKGSRQGIEKDMVAVYNNFLLGKVVETFPCYSKVLLITDKSCKVASYCSKTKSQGIHVGCNKKNQTVLNRVTHFSHVQKDDLVLSSGYGLVFPQGFALGKIDKVKKGDLYHEIKVKLVFDISKIDYCYVLKKGLQDQPEA